MDIDLSDIKSVTPAMVKYMKERDPKKYAQYQAAITGVAKVKTDLGSLASRNAREALTNRLLLAIIDGDTPDEADVKSLRDVYNIVDGSSAKTAIIGE